MVEQGGQTVLEHDSPRRMQALHEMVEHQEHLPLECEQSDSVKISPQSIK